MMRATFRRPSPAVRHCFAALAAVCWGSAHGFHNDADLENMLAKALRVRNARQERIHTITCAYRRENTAAQATIASHARDNNESLEAAMRALVFMSDWRYDETSAGLFRLQGTRLDDHGRPAAKHLVSSDGIESVSLLTEVARDGRETTRAEVGADLVADYSNLAIPRALLDGVLSRPVSRPLVGRVIGGTGAVATGIEPVDGQDCLVVRWEGPREAVEGKDRYAGPMSRFTVWLDMERQFVPRRARIDDSDLENKRLFTSFVWTAQRLDATELPGGADSQEIYWYPAEATLQAYGTNGAETIRNKIIINTLKINDTVDIASFTPAIPDGAEILNMTTTSATAAGGHVLFSSEGDGREQPSFLARHGARLRYIGGAIALVVAYLLMRGRRSAKA